MEKEVKETSTLRKLYLDDERNPHESHGFTVVRNFAEFVDYIVTKGIPDVISFDHDLGENHYMLQGQQWSIYPELVEQGEVDLNEFGETGYDIAKWFVNYCRDNNIKPKYIQIYVHSMNPVGTSNIINLLNPFLQECGCRTRVIRGSQCIEPLK